MAYDLFCRVIDNFGDAGVCWRLACDLVARGQTVRLFIDDATALQDMAPLAQRPREVQVLAFDTPASPADTVVEAFGCDPPAPYVRAMATATRAPVWINLEYLSAEPGVERLHGLPSPQANGLIKWFFYPGFTSGTGGLLREPGVGAARAAFDAVSAAHWLQALGPVGVKPRPGERLVSLFCYANPRLPTLLQALAQQPTLLLVTPGLAAQQMAVLPGPLPPGLRAHALPWLSQPDYDRLLWACDLNFVRGEDSMVRAHWAGRPFVWQIYPQPDGVHAGKLEALLNRMALPAPAAALWRAWNGLGPADVMVDELTPEVTTSLTPSLTPTPSLALVQEGHPPTAWAFASQAWCDSLRSQADLTTQLQAFVAAKRAAARSAYPPDSPGLSGPG